MTPQTVKDLAELNLTPEQLAERQAKVTAILHENGAARLPQPTTYVPIMSMAEISASEGPTPPARTRQPRSDKGTTRPPKAVREPVAAPAQAGALTVEQRNKIQSLLRDWLDTIRLANDAIDARDEAGERYDEYLDSLTASK